MGQEVLPTSELITPDPELPVDHTREAFARNTAVMSVGTALSRLSGFLRLAFALWAIGPTVSSLADTYNRANTTPNIIYELALGGILSSVFVPVFVEWLDTRARDEAWEVADRVLTLALVALAAVAAAGGLLAPWIIRLYLVGSGAAGPARAAQVALGAYFLRWFMPQVVFYGVGAVAIGLLNAHRRFAVPMFAPVLNNVSVIVTFVVYAGVRGSGRIVSPETITGAEKLILGFGTTLGVCAMTAALWPALHHLGYRWRLRFGWNHEAVRRLGKLAVWVVVYVVSNQVAYLIVIVLAGQQQGGYTVYAAAFILFQLPHAIFAVSVFTALLPAMSGRWAAGDADGVRALLSQGVRATAFIVLPAAAGYIALSLPIVRLLLQHGQTGAEDAELIASTLRFFAIGLLFFSMFQLLSRTFYAMQDTRTPALVNVAAAALNVVADLVYVFVFHLGVRGLALGHATSYVFSTIVCVAILHRRLGGLDEARILRATGRVAVAAAATASVAWGAARAVATAIGVASSGARLVQVGAGISAGFLVFGAASLIFRLEEADVLKEALARRFRR